MAKIELRHIYKKYDNGFEAVKDFHLEIDDNEFIIFVGPSGCGKSTTLRMIAGLEEISQGELFIDGEEMKHVSAAERDIAMVFQNYALYPHMTVRKNIAYSLKIHHVKKQIIDKKVQDAAEILGLTEVLDCKPGTLSGGQKQRVAMGRAIVRNPKVFLMDEPLSNLDAKLRGQMRVEIARLYHRLNSTFIYVTHDQTEAMTLGTRIVVMKDGIIQQVDTPQQLFCYPANRFVAGFIGTPPMNFFPATITEKDGRIYLLLNDREIEMPDVKAQKIKEHGSVGKDVEVGIRPEYIDIISEKEEQEHEIGTVDVYEMLGTEAILHISRKAGEEIIAKTSALSEVKTGDKVKLQFQVEHFHIFDFESGVTITN